MRFLAVIMCICFLGLSYPSVAETDCKAKAEQESSEAEDPHQHEQEEDDDCATSCLNYCCSSLIILQEQTYSLITNQSSGILESPPYYKFYAIEPSFSIWQPPKTI
ncbi:hypothetical protein [Pedobacter gandavensis]|uniref:hypothetical protein n=1 Tax=Pedobacter gandavensis TaxID=2679963 RepID=UPI00292FB730|nr:hypothetical protein [Pedobacter gandavensis]